MAFRKQDEARLTRRRGEACELPGMVGTMTIADDASILDTGIEAWRKVQEVNLTSVYYCCKYAIPYMQKQGKGSIINTASFVAVMGAATSQISYSASKGGVLSMSRELGVEFARQVATGHHVAGLACPLQRLQHGAVQAVPEIQGRAQGQRGQARQPATRAGRQHVRSPRQLQQ